MHAHDATPGISHTADWAEGVSASAGAGVGSAKHLIRNLSGREGLGLGRGRVSEGVEMEGAFAAPPPGMVVGERVALLHQPGSGSGSSPLTVPKQRERERQNGGGGGVGIELTGFRNVSGASTIDAPLESSDAKAKIYAPAPLTEGFEMVGQLPLPLPLQGIGDGDGDGNARREVYASAGFQPQEGGLGTGTGTPAQARVRVPASSGAGAGASAGVPP